MKLTICDRCRAEIIHRNKVHVYDYSLGKHKKGKFTITKPKRDDFDLCRKCREDLLKWIGGKNENTKR